MPATVNGNNNQVTINLTDSIPPDNLATIDKNGMVGNTYTKTQFDQSFSTKANEIEAKIENIQQMVESDFKGTLKPTDPAPTEDGSYKPEISSEDDKPADPNSAADWGKVYANAGNLRAKSGYDTLFYKKGAVWKKSETKLGGVLLASLFDPNNDNEAQAAKQINNWLFGQSAVSTTYIETDILNADTPINIGASSDAILTIIDSGRTAAKVVDKFRFNGSSGLVRLIKYSKSGSNVTLVAYQDVTLTGSVVEIVPTTTMGALGINEFYAIRMTSVSNGLAGRIGFESGSTPTYDCYSNVTNSGYLPDTLTLGSPLTDYIVGFNFDVSEGATSSVYNAKFDERFAIKSGVNKINGKKISIIGDSMSTVSGGGNANLGTDKQFYGLLKTKDNCSIYVNAVAGSSIVTGGQVDTVDFTDDTRIASLTTGNPDVILIFGGINDFLQDIPLGNLGDTSKTASFYGGLDYLYKKILSQNSNARVFHMTPLHTTYAQGGGLIPEYNGQNYLSEYIEAIYKVARRYGISVIDTNTLTGITCYNIASYADDLIHVKEAGHALIYKILINETNRIL